jgi:Group II intron, maturase-specific domain
VDRVIYLINPVLRGWVNYFAVGNSEHKLRPKPARQSSTLPVRGSGRNFLGRLGSNGREQVQQYA